MRRIPTPSRGGVIAFVVLGGISATLGALMGLGHSADSCAYDSAWRCSNQAELVASLLFGVPVALGVAGGLVAIYRYLS
jgi:hypothetical protein